MNTLNSAGAVCVVESFRKRGVAQELIKKSIELAKSKNAEFYTVHAVSCFARKIFEKLGFSVLNEIFYKEYFKADPEIISEISNLHPSATFFVKRL